MRQRRAGILLGCVIAVAPLCTHPCAAEIEATFYASFDKGVSATQAKGTLTPIEEKSVDLVNGIKGKAARMTGATRLRYACPGNYDNARGSLSLWFNFRKANNARPNYLFFEKGPYKPGSNILRVFAHQGVSLLYIFSSDPMGFHQSKFPLKEHLDEWHHMVLTWDKDIGDSLSIDGKQQPNGYGNLVSNYKRSSSTKESFWLGLVSSGTVMDLDEVRIFDRMLRPAEVLDAYESVQPLALNVADVTYPEGAVATLKLKVTNHGDTPAVGRVEWSVSDLAGAPLKTGHTDGEVTVSAGRETVIDVPVDTDGILGEHRVKLAFTGAAQLSRRFPFVLVPAPEPTPPKEVNPELDLQLVKRFDCTQDYSPDEFCHDGQGKVVQTPFGAYRETGAKRFSRFAYRVFVEEPMTPHLAVFEYPNDKSRVMEFMIDNRTNNNHQTIENGLIVGGEFRLSESFEDFPVLFWPTDRECVIQVMNWAFGEWWNEKDRTCPPAALKSLAVYKVRGGLPPVDFKNLPPPEKQRLAGTQDEDASTWREFSGILSDVTSGGATFENWYGGMKRRMEYMSYLGQNVFSPSWIHYSGALYRSDLMTKPYGRGGAYPDFVLPLAAEMCDRYGIGFMGGLCLLSMSDLDIEAFSVSQEQVTQGADTIMSVAWDGSIPKAVGISEKNVKFNILHPKVQEYLFALVDETMERVGNKPTFKGLNFWLWPSHSLWFGTLKRGYSDLNVGLFEKDTGIDVPGEVPDPERCVKRYAFLTKGSPAVREQWIAWRCRKVAEVWNEIAARIRRRRPAAMVTIQTWALFDSNRVTPNRTTVWKPWEFNSVKKFYREGGLDVDVVGQIPNLMIGHVLKPNMTPSDDSYIFRDFEFAPAVLDAFRNQGRNAVWLEQKRREFDKMSLGPRGSAAPMPGFWFQEGDSRAVEKSGAIMPAGVYYLEQYANSLAAMDVRLITDGGLATTVLGHERELREFLRAYRTIPAEHFPVFKEVYDPLCVRFRQRHDGYYFYLVNRVDFPVQARLTLPVGGKLLDLAADQVVSLDAGHAATLTVKPFMVRPFRFNGKGGLQKVDVVPPAEELAAMNAKTEKLLRDTQSVLTETLDANTRDELTWLVSALREARDGQHLASLRRMLLGYHARKVARFSTDEKLKAFLTEDETIRKTFAATAKIVVPLVDTVPEAGSPEWDNAPVLASFSEVKMVGGKYMLKHPAEKTELRVLRTAEAMGLLFTCQDREAASIKKLGLLERNKVHPHTDIVELFLSPTKTGKPYYHFTVDVSGNRREHRGYIRPTVKYQKSGAYNPDYGLDTHVTKTGWQARLVIPYKALDNAAPPSGGDAWTLNACRGLRDGTFMALRCSVYSKSGGGVHCPELFVPLTF